MERRGEGADRCAIAPDAVIADVARRHDLAPQQLSNWIRAAKDGPVGAAGRRDTFAPVVPVESAPPSKAAHERRSASTEIVIGTIKVRVPVGAEARDVEAVLRAVRRSNA